MSAKTAIEWTDRTWNPVRGCSLVSAGCTNCYAMRQAHRFSGEEGAYEDLTRMGPNGPVWTGKIKLVEDALLEPLSWRKPSRVFVNSMSDLFHEGVPDSFIDRVLAVIALCPHLTFQVLTKRSKRMREYMQAWAEAWANPAGMSEAMKDRWDVARKPLWQHFRDRRNHHMEEVVGIGLAAIRWPLPNLHLYVSPCDQKTAEDLIPDLLDTLAAVRGISLEPMLGAVELTAIKHTVAPGFFGDCLRWYHRGVCHEQEGTAYPTLDHVILGFESGPRANPGHPDWARKVRDDCAAAGVAFFFKQHGEYRHFASRTEAAAASNGKTFRFHRFEDGTEVYRVGKKRAGRALDGRTWDQMPGEPVR